MAGEHDATVHTIWQDPTQYDPLTHGPPYLPDRKTAAPLDRTAAQAEARPLIKKEADATLMVLSQVLSTIMKEYEEEPFCEMAALLSFLRAVAQVHQAHHWMTQGVAFYADHLLFERLYEQSLGDIDGLAERTVGAGSPHLVNPFLTSRHVAVVVQTLYADSAPHPVPEDFPLLSLRAELRFLVLLKLVHGLMTQKGTLSHGIDNLLQGIADKHEGFVYLLKQRTGARTATTKRASNDPRWKIR